MKIISGHPRTGRAGLALAALVVAMECVALGIECRISLVQSFAEGRGLFEALFLFFRFFTILTNSGIAVLMLVTVWRHWRERPLPGPSFYGAALVYSLVAGITYELLLRRLWSPHGVQYYTDLTMHDLVPVLMLVFWIGFAPRTPLSRWDPVRWLEVPAVYFGATLLSGFFVEDYPYGFLDPDKIGYADVIRNAVVFLAVFYGAGVIVKASRWTASS